MKTYFFKVPGKLVGYTRMTRRGRFSPKAKAYHVYMEKVQWLAKQAGVPLPLVSSDDKPIRIETRPYTIRPRGQVHPDPDNIWKAVADALAYPRKRDQDCFGTIGYVMHVTSSRIAEDWVDVEVRLHGPE